MRVCGIVAEYNPFHNGHAWQIAEIRRLMGEESPIVCCMSGNFVQRGEAAIIDKFSRAEMAVRGGADLVIELPSPYSLSSAEAFAENAVMLLENAGCTDLFFGSECGDTAALEEIAAVLLEHETVAATLAHLESGISYAAARERALYARIREKAALIQSPNNILGVEYCKALLKRKSAMRPHALPRRGPEHDAALPDDSFCSASALRALFLKEGCGDALGAYLPQSSLDILRREHSNGRAPVSLDAHPRMVLSALRRLSREELGLLPGASEGLEHRLYQALRENNRLSDAAAAAKTKRYAYSRIRRMMVCAFLGITAEEVCRAPVYLRVLAFGHRGRPLLKAISTNEHALPLLVKPAHCRLLSPDAEDAFRRESERTDLYQMLIPAYETVFPGSEYRQTPFYLK